ncbi:hypothetical protein SLEP1_g29414 [Rubroshorea leprosula]|uniref:Uncharacterized protein n=1 Tax=Rubroshorea leprosula TaxID=152421 RepID=A0AAV5JWU6_9ROSI|nr:hypothetical protein SLEP1_g29414 [Rubroshorea leprosula]
MSNYAGQFSLSSGLCANYQGCQNNPIRRAPTAYGPYPASYSSIPGAGNGLYQISHTRQYIDGRNTVPSPGTNFSGGSMIEPSLSETALSSEYVYYPPNGQISSFVYPYPDLQAPRPPTALSSALPSNPNVVILIKLEHAHLPCSILEDIPPLGQCDCCKDFLEAEFTTNH